jgi:hypothetical protein
MVIGLRATTLVSSTRNARSSDFKENSMPRPIGALVGFAAVALLAAGSLSFAAEEIKKDPEVAAEYRSEAMQLRDKAEHHRKLAANYKSRTQPKGAGSYASVARHCEKLAQYYEDAAKEADALSSELSKQ